MLSAQATPTASGIGDLQIGAGYSIAFPDYTSERFKGIGATGSDIFLREIQDTWTWVRPYFDDRALGAAAALGLPSDPDDLSQLASGDNAGLAAALVRASLNDDVRDAVAG